MSTEIELEPQALALGAYLRSLRRSLKMTLRAVEDATDRDVSNAYLSQVENGRKPGPDVLYSLAQVYGVSHEDLMTRAGYLGKSDRNRDASTKHGRLATLARENLTPEEEAVIFEALRAHRASRATP